MASVVLVAVLVALSTIRRSKASPVNPGNFTLERPETSAALCNSYAIPLEITSENFTFNFTRIEDNLDLSNVVFQYARKDSNVAFHPYSGKKNVTAKYTIGATFCTPKTPSGNGREKTVLLATHGIAYDGQYWDSQYKPKQYSFVEAMVQHGFSVLYYDRLGTGHSQTESGYTNQAAIQIEIIEKLASLIRKGLATGPVTEPDSVVLVGHSFGSYLSNLAVVKYPHLFDAAVLTGMAYGGDSDFQLLAEAFGVRIASTIDPSRFSHLDNGYNTFVDIVSHAHTFFKAPAYEIDALKYAHSIHAPWAITEFFSTAGYSLIAPEFKGTVLVTAGEFDLAACAGECYSSFKKQSLEQIFPKIGYKEAFVQPGAGHGLNFATNATGFYEGIAGFLERAGF